MKIGFVDYYIAEWHANNYPAWFAAAAKERGVDAEIAYAWAEKYDSPAYNMNTDEWCEKYGVQKCDSIEELCEKSDAIVVLAPSNPETHLRYAEKALKFGKRTYIDKTFAPDTATAEKIFALAEKYGATIFSSSALRYATELEGLSPDNFVVTGGGSNFPEYLVHQAEIAEVLARGSEFTGGKVERHGEQRVCSLEFDGGKRATLIFSPSLPFTVCAETAGGDCYRTLDSDYFGGLIRDILGFFVTGVAPVGKEDTMRVMRIRETLIKADEKQGERL